VAVQPKDPAIQALGDRLDMLREAVATAAFEARVTTVAPDAFRVELLCAGSTPVTVEPDLTLQCWPVTIATGNAVAIDHLKPRHVSSLLQIASFGSFSRIRTAWYGPAQADDGAHSVRTRNRCASP